MKIFLELNYHIGQWRTPQTDSAIPEGSKVKMRTNSRLSISPVFFADGNMVLFEKEAGEFIIENDIRQIGKPIANRSQPTNAIIQVFCF